MELKLTHQEKKMVLENRLNNLIFKEENKSKNLEMNMYLNEDFEVVVALNDNATKTASVTTLNYEQIGKMYNFLITRHRMISEIKEVSAQMCENSKKNN